MDELRIQEFWNAHPCGEGQVQSVDPTLVGDYARFFEAYDELKYHLERHIPSCLDALDVKGKRLLEIGPGEGAEAEQLIRRGARWTGVDLTSESVERVRTRLALRGLPLDEIRQGSVLRLPFDDHAFDMVFSHGVLHHVPDIARAQREIHRVLRPGGELVIMVYARWSLNYVVAIGAIRRVVVLGAYPFKCGRQLDDARMLDVHVRNAKEIGLRKYLALRTFVHANTDGPNNPYSRVYDRKRLRRDFSMFTVTNTYKHFMHAPPLPVHDLPAGPSRAGTSGLICGRGEGADSYRIGGGYAHRRSDPVALCRPVDDRREFDIYPSLPVTTGVTSTASEASTYNASPNAGSGLCRVVVSGGYPPLTNATTT